MASASERICGKCPDFSLNAAGGEKVGQFLDDDQQAVFNLGYCRAPFGLLLKVRPENAVCTHPAMKNVPLESPMPQANYDISKQDQDQLVTQLINQ